MDPNKKHIRNPNAETETYRLKNEQSMAEKKERLIRMQRQRNLRRRQTKLVLLTSLFVFFAILISLLVWLKFDSGIGNHGSIDRSLQLSQGEKKVKNLKYTYRNGVYYVGLSALSSTFGYTISGDKKEMGITLPNKTSDTAEFQVGTDKAQINGISIFLDAPCYLSGDELYIPASFYGTYLTGTKFKTKATKKTETAILSVTEKKPSNANSEGKATTDKGYAFTITGNKTTPAVSESGTYGSSVQNYEYKIDMKPYESFINPADQDAYLFLVDAQHPLAKDYLPPELTDVIFTRKDKRAMQKMQKTAAMALEAMLKEAKANGYDDLSVTSAYRSYAYQKTLFDNQVTSFKAAYGDKAEAKAAESIARPGTSEHQSGLCADLHNMSEANQAFANTDAYKWLSENCSKFGFIVRYPNGKQNITGIIFEPWHYRFVGRYHAEKIMKQGITLEEYMQSRTS